MNAAKSQLGTYKRAPQEKRELLIAAARELFQEQGFGATSTQQIAARAGVSEGILFHHFGSKRGLFETIAEDFLQAAAMATVPDETRSNPDLPAPQGVSFQAAWKRRRSRGRA